MLPDVPNFAKNEESIVLNVYDVLGDEVKTLIDEYKNAGTYEINFDAGNLASGLYYYKITCGKYTETKKMILIR